MAERIYYHQPALLEFSAEVTAIREMARVDGRQVWQIALDRTAFYPSSGGQPFDTGVLIATSRSGASLSVPITGVEEDEAGEVWHTTGKPLQEGTAVQGMVDARRRHDHMQQHSGQHLLSAILHRDLGAKTVSFHLGSAVSTIDLESGVLNEEALLSVENHVNEVIAQAVPISMRTVPHDEAERLLAEGVLRKLPPRTGDMRLIEIGSLDCNACGGTHVASTAALGPLLLRGTERVRDTVRLAFVCGERARLAARNDSLQLAALAKSLSTGPDEIAGSVARLQAENRAAEKERAQLLAALAEAQAPLLASDAEKAGLPYVVHTLQASQPGCDAGFARLLASRIVAATPCRAALIAAPEGERCSVALAVKGGAADCGTILRTALAAFGGRGGGSREMAQGSLPQEQLPAFLARVAMDLPA